MKKSKHMVLAVVMAGVLLTGVIGYAAAAVISSATVNKNIKPIAPLDDEGVVIANDVVAKWSKDYTTFISRDYFGYGDQYAPEPLTVSWVSVDADSYVFRLGMDKKLTNAKEYAVTTNEVSLEALYTGTVYYWQVEAVFTDRTEVSKVFSFRTAYTRRAISLTNVSNTRDIGGIALENGGRIKQGMVYRGANLDSITAEAKEIQKELYGIKTDLDFRASGEAVYSDSPLGTDVQYINISAPMYTSGLENPANWFAVRDIFKVFADESNYPIYMHCAIGRDRTGTFAMLLEGLLGATKEELYKDYEISYLSFAGCSGYDASQNQFAETHMLNNIIRKEAMQ